MNVVSKELFEVISILMDEPLLREFNLGGGTNLSIKYNYRVSTDIDLFSPGVVGYSQMNEIHSFLRETFAKCDIQSSIRNNSINQENLILINADLIKNDNPIKIDIIQNLPLQHPIIEKDGIRLINDLDIGPLKLLSAADRGAKKDFYDLYLLANKYDLSEIYDQLLKRYKQYDSSDKKFENIFNKNQGKPKSDLLKSITPLGNFNNAGDQKITSNRIVPNRDHEDFVSWPVLKNRWIKMLNELAKERGLEFSETPVIRRKLRHFR